MKLNLGCGGQVLDGWINVDKNSTDPKVYKVNFAWLTLWEEEYDSRAGLTHEEERFVKELHDINEVRAYHVLEHVPELDLVMKWIHKICDNGAIIDIVVPLANTLWDCANPDHRRKFNHKTFLYYTRDFITSDLGLFRGFDLVSQHLEREPDEWFEGVSWIVANLHTKLRVIK